MITRGSLGFGLEAAQLFHETGARVVITGRTETTSTSSSATPASFASTRRTRPPDVWDETFAISVRGTFLMSKHTIPLMLEQGWGCIVDNSSILGSRAAPGCAAHIATMNGSMLDSDGGWIAR